MGINEKWDNNDIEERKLEGRGNNEPKKERKNKKREEQDIYIYRHTQIEKSIE